MKSPDTQSISNSNSLFGLEINKEIQIRLWIVLTDHE